MAVTVQMQFESAVTEMYQNAFVGSSIEHGRTIIQCDLRKLDFQRALGTTSTICGRQAPSHVDIHALSTFHHPIAYQCIVAQGSYLNDQHQRVSFTPERKGVSPFPAYEPQRRPVGLLSRGGLRGQPQAQCAPLFRAVPDADDEIFDQTLD